MNQKKLLTFFTIGYSTEDLTVFEQKGVDFLNDMGWEKDHVISCFNDMIEYKTVDKFDKSQYEEFKERLMQEPDYAELDDTKNAVANFEKFVENKNGVYFGWSVEYDDNCIFFENVTVDELKEILLSQ